MMTAPVATAWLDLACSHAATVWLTRSLRQWLPLLVNGQLTAEAFAAKLTALLEQRKLLTPAQQKNPRSNVVQALKAIDPQHPAIPLVGLTTEEYRDLNEQQRGRLGDRQTKFIRAQDAERLVERATQLLGSAEWSEVGAGLAVLIGRRISEILLSDFALRSPWSLTFSEMAKKPKGTGGLTIEIPTLAPAETVLAAITRLQQGLGMADLKLESLTPKMAKQRVNGRYSGAIAKACHDQFADLVPARNDGENLYTHIFRAVYATIASHWFCPPHIPEHTFKAEIQGHFTITSDGQKLPNFSARANYDDYAIGSEAGNREGRLGIKLGQLPGLVVMEAFRPQADHPLAETETETLTIKETEMTLEQPTATQPLEETELSAPTRSRRTALAKPSIKRPPLRAADLDRLGALMTWQGVKGSVQEQFTALLNLVETWSQQQQQERTKLEGALETIHWFTAEIDALRTRIAALETERDALNAAQVQGEELARLRAENGQLKREVQQTHARLEAIQKLLGGGAAAIPSSVPPEPVRRSQPALHEASPPVAVRDPQPPATPSIAPPATEPPVRPRGRQDTAAKINQIVDALVNWNTAQSDRTTMLRISITPIKALASAMGANYQPVIQQVLTDRATELEALHQHLMLGTRHNAGVHRKEAILQAIARDVLELDHWGEVRLSA